MALSGHRDKNSELWQLSEAISMHRFAQLWTQKQWNLFQTNTLAFAKSDHLIYSSHFSTRIKGARRSRRGEPGKPVLYHLWREYGFTQRAFNRSKWRGIDAQVSGRGAQRTGSCLIISLYYAIRALRTLLKRRHCTPAPRKFNSWGAQKQD